MAGIDCMADIIPFKGPDGVGAHETRRPESHAKMSTGDVIFFLAAVAVGAMLSAGVVMLLPL
jgi:hypothetical protein